MRQLNLDHLVTLVKAAELGSLAAAARALHLSAPAVSLHIQELESRVGVPLLQRGRGRARLTQAGEVLVRGGVRALAGFADVVERARARGHGRAGTIRMAATAGVNSELLPKLLDTLERSIPDVDVHLEACGSRESLARLRAGSLDLAVVALPLDPGTDILLQPWRKDPMAAYLPRSWDAPARVSPHWLAERRWMSFGAPTQMYALLADWFARAGAKPQPRFRLNQPEALLALVRAGHGAALLPARSEVSEGTDEWLQTRRLTPPLWRELAIARLAAGADPAVEVAFEVLVRLGTRGGHSSKGRGRRSA